MREVVSIATMMMILAFAGLEPSHAQDAQTCKVDMIMTFFSGGC